MENHNEFTIKDVYALVDRTRLEFTSAINTLRDEFINFERGRLTNVEKDIVALKTLTSAKEKNSAITWERILTIISIIVAIAAVYLKFAQGK